MGRRPSNEPVRPSRALGWYRVSDARNWPKDQLVLVDHPAWVRPIVQTAEYALGHNKTSDYVFKKIERGIIR